MFSILKQNLNKLLISITLMIILQINQISIKCEDEWYLYRYSKLHNSYKFDISKEDKIKQSSKYNCKGEKISKGKIKYNDVKKCGTNIITEVEFNKTIKEQDNGSNYFKDEEDELCLPSYKTLETSYLICNYKMKSKMIAVCLEISGLGFGHLYLQNYLLFFAKFLFSYLCCYMITGIIFFVGALSDTNTSQATQKRSKKIVKWILPIYCLIYFGDIILLIIGLRRDSNLQDLKG
jgi:hypothetical protein